MRRVVSLAVLTATVYWADCTPNQIASTTRNEFFVGCFNTTAKAPGFDEIIVVLEASAEDKEALGGCLQRTLGNQIEHGTLAGVVTREDARTAEVTVMVTSPQRPTPYMLRVLRAPIGEVEAVTVSLVDVGGAPFPSAVDVPRCVLVQECSELSMRVPFLPGGDAP